MRSRAFLDFARNERSKMAIETQERFTTLINRPGVRVEWIESRGSKRSRPTSAPCATASGTDIPLEPVPPSI